MTLIHDASIKEDEKKGNEKEIDERAFQSRSSKIAERRPRRRYIPRPGWHQIVIRIEKSRRISQSEAKNTAAARRAHQIH